MSRLAENIVFAGLAPHPPIIVPEVGGDSLRECESTVEAMKEFARRFMAAKPDSVVIISPHAPRRPRAFGYYDLSVLNGDFSQFGAPEPKIMLHNATECWRTFLHLSEKHGLEMWPFEGGPRDHGVMVPLYYLWRAGWRGDTGVIGLNYPGEGQLEEMGALISEGIASCDGRVALIASGDMSHRLQPGAPGGFHPNAQRFDDTFVDLLKTRDFRKAARIDEQLVAEAGQDVLESTTIVLSALGWEAPESEVLSYEGPFGVGYCVAVFRADPFYKDGGKLLLRVARQALEQYVKTGETLCIDDLVPDYLAESHGVFVTIRRKDGSLRGCIGVIEPTQGNLVEEVIDRAREAAKWAYGGPVVESELPNLVYSVSVLSPLQWIHSPKYLEPSLFGVLMRDDTGRQAVLLPGIESIKTVEQQLNFVREKAGIPEGVDVKLYMFSTDHFEEAKEPAEAVGEESSYPARWWATLEDGRVHCYLCPRHCKIKEGQRGFCFVRAVENNRLVLTTHGRSSGFCIDPIEKKPLNHFLPGTSVLSFGTAGCNLGCRFCQNWDISKVREMDRLMDTATPLQIAVAAEEYGCRSVAFTYNDPVIFAEYAIDIARACRERNINTVAVSAGYITDEARGEFFSNIDAANIDLKGFTEEFYQKYCFAELEPVKKTLKYLKRETDVWLEITTLLIPDLNDGDEEIHHMCDWITENLGTDVPLHFTAFHPDFKMSDHLPTPHSTLLRARKIALSKGLRYVYTGNVHDEEAGSTYCPSCETELIRRDWYEINSWRIDNGKCPNCGQVIPGRFEAEHGTWGAKRQPIQIT